MLLAHTSGEKRWMSLTRVETMVYSAGYHWRECNGTALDTIDVTTMSQCSIPLTQIQGKALCIIEDTMLQRWIPLRLIEIDTIMLTAMVLW